MPIVLDPPVSPPLSPAPDDGSQLWEIFYEGLGFHVEDDVTGDLRRYLEGLSAPLQTTFDLVRPRPGMAGWAILLDPDLCPAWALPFSAMLVGVVITPEMDEAQIRAEIRQPTGWKRGQTESIRIATRRTLKPVVEGEELLVIVHPNFPAVGYHYVRTLLSQTPEPSRTKAVVRDAVPAWSVLDYEAINGVTVEDVAASTKWTTVADLAAAFESVQKLAEIVPAQL